jgi:hypothetical protein
MQSRTGMLLNGQMQNVNICLYVQCEVFVVFSDKSDFGKSKACMALVHLQLCTSFVRLLQPNVLVHIALIREIIGLSGVKFYLSFWTFQLYDNRYHWLLV